MVTQEQKRAAVLNFYFYLAVSGWSWVTTYPFYVDAMLLIVILLFASAVATKRISDT